MKSFTFWSGLVLIFVGLFVFLKNVSVGSFRFWYWGPVNTGAILIILLLVAFVAMIVKWNKITLTLFVLCLFGLIMSIILGIDVRIKHMSVLDLLLMLGTLFGGVGLTLKGLIDSRKEK